MVEQVVGIVSSTKSMSKFQNHQKFVWICLLRFQAHTTCVSSFHATANRGTCLAHIDVIMIGASLSEPTLIMTMSHVVGNVCMCVAFVCLNVPENTPIQSITRSAHAH